MRLPMTLFLVPVLTILAGLVASLIFRGSVETELLVLLGGGALVLFVIGMVSYRLGIRWGERRKRQAERGQRRSA
jgi:hypothetical protein